MKCNSSDYEDLAIWDEENGVFTNKKGIEIVKDKYGVFKLYDLEDEEE
jgi:hypothetical protein